MVTRTRDSDSGLVCLLGFEEPNIELFKHMFKPFYTESLFVLI